MDNRRSDVHQHRSSVKENKDKGIPDRFSPIIPDWQEKKKKKKRNKGLEGKRKHKERSQSGRNSRRID